MSEGRSAVDYLKHLLISTRNTLLYSEKILNAYVMSAPGPQNALDILEGEWVSKMPEEWADLQAGSMPLFADERISWFIEELGGVEDLSVLELGPLEAGHTYMLAQAGVASVLGIEANPRAYLKCLIIKEIMQLKQARFLCGDFVKYLQTAEDAFDFCLACGVLYHMVNPVELIALLARVTKRICLWTHYYDEDVISQKRYLSRQFPRTDDFTAGGFRHRRYHRVYQKGYFSWASFHGGGTPYSCWLSREDLLNCLKYFGFTNIVIGSDDRDHQNGPNIALIASCEL